MIFTAETVNARAEFDLVELHFGSDVAAVPYQSAFQIVTNGILAAKMAMRHEKVSARAWRNFLEMDRQPVALKPNRTFRRSGNVANVRIWSINWDGACVCFVLDDAGYTLHYSDAFLLLTRIRHAARAAQAWAGDGSKRLRMSAHLTDAETNYKHGHA